MEIRLWVSSVRMRTVKQKTLFCDAHPLQTDSGQDFPILSIIDPFSCPLICYLNYWHYLVDVYQKPVTQIKVTKTGLVTVICYTLKGLKSSFQTVVVQ